MCLLSASERLLHLTYHKNCISKSLPPPQNSAKLVAKWWLSLFPTPLKYCSKGPNLASHPTIRKCSCVQINLNLKLTTKTISNIHLSIHPSILPVSQTYTIHPSIHLTYHKNYLKFTLIPLFIHPYILPVSNTIHPSIHTSDLPQKLNLKLSQTYTSCISNLHYPSIHPSI